LSLSRSSDQLPKTDETNTQEGPTAGGPPKRTPDATAGDAPGDHPENADNARDNDTGDQPGNHPQADLTDSPTASDGTGAHEDTTTGEGTLTDEAADDGATAGDGPVPPVAGGGWREKHADAARIVARTTTVLAAVLVLFAILMPNQFTLFTPSRFARLPAEPILIAAVLLALPPRPRRVVAVLAGVSLGLLTVLNCVDMGFYSVLSRPFYLVSDWPLFSDGESFLKDSVGEAAAIGTVIGVVVLVIAVLALMTLAVIRMSNLLVRHRTTATRSTLVLGAVWVACSTLGVQVAGRPLASRSTTQHVEDRVHMVTAGLADERAFAKAAKVDAFAKTPANQLLTGLRGKDVIITFIESYGRNAVQDSSFAPGVDKVLANGDKQLAAAGFAARSGFLTSPVRGAGSWLAHSTFLSGLWVPTQQRYRNVTSSNRLTLTSAFQKTNAWRTVGIMPGVTKAWPEGKFFGLDNIYDSAHLGYTGPKFSWSPVPDQFSLAAFQRLEHGKTHDKPLMTEMVLTSSHAPWAPLPKTVGWDQLGDGSIFKGIEKAGESPTQLWKNTNNVRAAYGQSIQYSLTSLIDFMTKYGNKNTVLVVLGDHQPVPAVTGNSATRDVPISIVAHDPAVLKRISSWGWTDSMKPAKTAPVWRMDTFRDRFLTAYGPQPTATTSTASASPSAK
jgi:hypothetical protein